MAGTPTVAEVDAMLQKAVDILEVTRAFGNGTLLGKCDSLEQAIEGDYALGLVNQTAAVRATVAQGASGARAAALLTPIMREYARLAGSPYWNGSLGPMLLDVHRYWLTNSKTIEKRTITFGSPSASGSNTGTGTLSRCTKSAGGYDLDGCHVEVKKAECIRDQNTGRRRHEEVFLLTGEDAGLDSLTVSGSGAAAEIPARHAGTSKSDGSLLKNASFQTHDGTTDTTQFSGWTATVGANVAQVTTSHYRGFPGNTDTHSLKLVDNVTISQALSIRNESLSRNVPYYFGVAYNRETGSGTGTITIGMGTNSDNVVLAAQTGWNILAIALDADSWYENFVEDSLDLYITLSGRTTGYTLIDDAIFCALTPFDGTWWLLRGGATPFMAANATLPYGDVFTITDTGGGASTAKIAYWLWRAFGFVPLPTATSGAETVADP